MFQGTAVGKAGGPASEATIRDLSGPLSAADKKKQFDLLRELHAEMELLEAERDGALAQVARLTRELREEKARGARATEEARRAREEAGEAVLAAQEQADEAAESRKALEELHKALSEARGRISGVR